MKIRFTRIIYSVIARNQGERKTQKKEINNLFHQERLFFRRKSPDAYIIRKAHALIRKVTWFRSTPTQGITPKSQANICINPTESRSTRYRQHKSFHSILYTAKIFLFNTQSKHRQRFNIIIPQTQHIPLPSSKNKTTYRTTYAESPHVLSQRSPGTRSYSPSQKAKQRQHLIIDAVAVLKISYPFDRRWRNAHSASDVL